MAKMNTENLSKVVAYMVGRAEWRARKTGDVVQGVVKGARGMSALFDDVRDIVNDAAKTADDKVDGADVERAYRHALASGSIIGDLFYAATPEADKVLASMASKRTETLKQRNATFLRQVEREKEAKRKGSAPDILAAALGKAK